MTFEPGMTQRIVAGAKRRVVPRSQWKSRAKDYSTIFISATFLWEAIIKPAYGADLPAWLVVELTKALVVSAGIAKFIRQGVPKEKGDNS